MNDRGGRGYVDRTRGTRPSPALATHSAFAWSKEGSGKLLSGNPKPHRLHRSALPRFNLCIVVSCYILWITTQHLQAFPLSTLHSVGGRLALCLCLYFTETSCCAAVGTRAEET